MRFPTACFIVAILYASLVRADLAPDQVALIVNKNSPASAQLADFYIKARNIPPGRVIELDLSDTDEITFDRFERYVLPEVRRFLREQQLETQVRCLVTVFGVPLKIAARVNSPNETRELAALRAASVEAIGKLRTIVDELERRAMVIDVTFKPLVGPRAEAPGPDGVLARLQHVEQALVLATQRINDPTERQQSLRETTALLQQIRESKPQPVPAINPDESPTSAPAAPGEDVSKLDPGQLQFRRYDPAARARLREIASREGLVAYARIVDAQVQYLTTDATDAAFDSELALVWWPSYPRSQWVPNVLNYELLESRAPPVVMTMRLDAPNPQLVRDLIANSIRAEREGLKGKLVVDGGGAAKLDPQRKQPGFWPFEAHFKELATLARNNARGIEVTYDDGPEVIPQRSAKDVALYTGWYSVGQYVPSCTFDAGAVGYHVASYEMTSLHNAADKGWCRGLLNDGVSATLGPVSEPYLHAFPRPDDFFPLLLTGKFTLAEVYWHTNPLVSWKMCVVGDPLYTPYRTNPPLKVQDLPERMLTTLFQQKRK